MTRKRPILIPDLQKAVIPHLPKIAAKEERRPEKAGYLGTDFQNRDRIAQVLRTRCIFSPPLSRPQDSADTPMERTAGWSQARDSVSWTGRCRQRLSHW